MSDAGVDGPCRVGFAALLCQSGCSLQVNKEPGPLPSPPAHLISSLLIYVLYDMIINGALNTACRNSLFAVLSVASSSSSPGVIRHSSRYRIRSIVFSPQSLVPKAGVWLVSHSLILILLSPLSSPAA